MQAFKIYRRRYFTLLELVIAMFLAVALLSILLFFYRQVSYIGVKMDAAQNQSFELRFIENRLASVLPKAFSSKDKTNKFHFFTSNDTGGFLMPGSPSLIFAFDNGVELDKMMAYRVIGRIFLDNNGRLILAKWPSENRWKEGESPPMNIEVLLEKVTNLRFEFYVPPVKVEETHKKDKFTIPEELRGQWISEWKKEYHQLPGMIKIKVVRGEETMTFAFPFPGVLTPITYVE